MWMRVRWREEEGCGPPLRVRVLVTSRLVLLSCPITILMPSLNHIRATQQRISRGKHSFDDVLDVKQQARCCSRLFLMAKLEVTRVALLAEMMVEQLARIR